MAMEAKLQKKAPCASLKIKTLFSSYLLLLCVRIRLCFLNTSASKNMGAFIFETVALLKFLKNKNIYVKSF